MNDQLNITNHLAIFQNPYLSLIFSHKKTIESRWSIRKIAPYKKINEGDRLLLKLSGKPILGEAYVDKVLFFEDLNPQEVKNLMEKYKDELQINDEYYEIKKSSKYATLIWLKDVKEYESPTEFKKNNQLSWISDFKL